MDFSFIYQYQGLIFDLDGTLTDSMPFHAKAWDQVAREHGFSISKQQIYDLGGSSSHDIARHFKELGNPVGDVDAFVQRKIDVYTANIDKVALFENIANILITAKGKGLKIAIGTGTRIKNATYILKAKKLDQYIDAVVTAEDVSLHKPNPDTFLQAAKRIGLKPQDCLVFEDGILGIEAAKNGNFDCIQVDNDKLVRFIKA